MASGVFVPVVLLVGHLFGYVPALTVGLGIVFEMNPLIFGSAVATGASDNPFKDSEKAGGFGLVILASWLSFVAPRPMVERAREFNATIFNFVALLGVAMSLLGAIILWATPFDKIGFLVFRASFIATVLFLTAAVFVAVQFGKLEPARWVFAFQAGISQWVVLGAAMGPGVHDQVKAGAVIGWIGLVLLTGVFFATLDAPNKAELALTARAKIASLRTVVGVVAVVAAIIGAGMREDADGEDGWGSANVVILNVTILLLGLLGESAAAKCVDLWCKGLTQALAGGLIDGAAGVPGTSKDDTHRAGSAILIISLAVAWIAHFEPAKLRKALGELTQGILRVAALVGLLICYLGLIIFWVNRDENDASSSYSMRLLIASVYVFVGVFFEGAVELLAGTLFLLSGLQVTVLETAVSDEQLAENPNTGKAGSGINWIAIILWILVILRKLHESGAPAAAASSAAAGGAAATSTKEAAEQPQEAPSVPQPTAVEPHTPPPEYQAREEAAPPSAPQP